MFDETAVSYKKYYLVAYWIEVRALRILSGFTEVMFVPDP